MRSKIRRPPPAPRGTQPSQLLLAVVLVVVGATAALGFERLVPAGGATGVRATPSAAASDSQDPFATDDPALASDIPSDVPVDSSAPSASPVAPALEKAMPHSVNGAALTVETDLGSTILGNDPSSRSFAAAVTTLGYTSDKLEIGFAYDEAGSLQLTVLGFRIQGLEAAKLQPLVLQSWLSASAAGVKSEKVTLAGVATTKVSYGDEGADEYVLVKGDVVFIVETSDGALATAVVTAINAPAGPGSLAPSGSPAAS